MSALSLRTFFRRCLIAFVVAVVITSTVIVAAYAQAEHKVDSVAKAHIDPSVLRPGGNYLLIGSDTRAFVDSPAEAQHFGSAQQETGQRSDTIMIAHVDGNGNAFLVSFPRDLWVAIPGLGHAKINAAFNAGPQRVIETIEQDFDVPVSHYLQVDFAGFRKIVNAIGSIPIYFPAPARDVKSGLYVNQAGCQHLNGDAALAFVRSRYYQSLQNGQWRYDPTSDLGRIKRQQYFLRTLASQTLHAVASSPWKAGTIADAMLTNLARDPKLGFSSLRALAYAFHKAGDVETLTLPTHRQFENGQDALVLDDAKAAPILARLRGAGSGATTPTAGKLVAPASVRLTVQNGSGRRGLGASAVRAARAAGFTVVGAATNADRRDYSVTEVRYAPGADAKAATVLAALGGAGKVVALNAPADGADVVVVLGADYTGLSTPTTTGSSTTKPGSAKPAAGSSGAAAGANALPGVGC